MRYLAQGNFGLVREALHERGVLLRNAPHLVHRRDFVVPAYRWLALPYYGTGLKVYDWMSGSLGLGQSRWLGRAGVVARLPAIRPRVCAGESSTPTDSSTMPGWRSRWRGRSPTSGGTALNYMKVIGFTKRDGRIAEVVARDAETGEEFRVEARSVINAAGVYVDAVRRLDDPAAASTRSPQPGCPPGARPFVLSGRHRACWFRAPTTAACSSRFPGTAGCWSERPTRRWRDVAIEPRPLGEEVDLSAGLPRSILQPPARPRRRPEHLRRPASAVARQGRRANRQALA